LQFAARITIKALMRRGVTLVLFVLLAAASGRAQQVACLERTIPVSISSSDGSSAPELTLSSLAGTYDKESVTVKAVDIAEKPPRVILLIDASGSMKWRANAIGEAAQRVLESLPVQSEVGLVFFQSKIIPVALPTSDRKSLLLQVEALRDNRQSFKGRTALRAAVLAGLKMLGVPTLGDSLYLISDGGDNQSKMQEGEMERELEKSSVRLFALVLSGGITARTTPEEVAGPNVLKTATHNTGGTAIEAGIAPQIDVSGASDALPNDMRVDFVKKDGTPTQLGQDLQNQIRQIVNFYRVNVALPQVVDKPKDLKLEMPGFSKSRQRRLTLSYPHLVFPCH
jgi:hypothetical protein